VNSRVLVIDDEENVRDGIRAMLTPRVRDTSEIDALGMRLFGGGGVEKPPPPPLPFRFEVDVAPTGQEGLWRVADALAEGRPYAALFVDMRMPGWDGLETVRRIREIDDQAEVVFVTAYSDYAVREIVARAGMNVSYHCKPFSSEEIQQLAIKAVYEWNKARQVEEMVSAVGRLAEMDASPDAMRREVLAFAGGHLGAEAGILAERAADGSWQSAAERGDVGDAFRQAALACAGTFAAEGARRFACCRDGCICLRFGKAAAVALAVDATQPGPTSERFYPVRLYLEHAWHVWENARLRAELAHKEKLSAIGAAIGMVAHDLRGPLCTIQGTGDCLLDGYAEGEAEKEEMLRGIRNTAKSCLGYVEDVLDFVRGAPPRLAAEAVECGSWLAEVAGEIRAWPECEGVRVVVHGDAPARLWVDRPRLRRMLLNLAKNAAEAMRDPREGREPRIALGWGVAEGRGWIEVADNGPGLPEKVRRQMFEMFVTVDKAGGTGLGLAIVKKFADAHGAELRVHTGDGGTTFRMHGFALPPNAGGAP
jgi:two-component system, NtrC family, sensor kinase